MKTVLLASASKVFLKRNSDLMMRRGFRLFSVTTGSEALKLNKEYHFDLILADLKLEDMGGSTLCTLVRKEKTSRDVPVILFCHNIPGSIERVEQSSANAMLIKPVDPINLLETVGSYLDLQLGRNKRVVVQVKVISKQLGLEFYCFTHDISNTGILLETEFQLAIGSRIVCQFTLPGSCQIESEWEVIRCKSAQKCENLYGVKFVNLPISSRRAIDDFINSTASSGDSTKEALTSSRVQINQFNLPRHIQSPQIST